MGKRSEDRGVVPWPLSPSEEKHLRKMLSGIAVLALATASVTAAFAMPMGSMNMGGGMMPKCTSATGPVVWMSTSTKIYHMKGTPKYGKGKGMYVCRSTAMAHGGHAAMMGGSMGGSMGHGSMGGGAMNHSIHGASTHGGTMPASTPGPLNGGATSGTSMGSPMPKATPPLTPGSPMPNGNMGNSSGGQGNTGGPGAGGQTPNNPASTSNNATPQPRPT